ncbi:3,4-dihydroxy-2-butanone-4-phosphate synthase [Halorubellus sp. PRR65]|uniref:3,4-dihydroxy-2-butanone-4-phosphate synthase n=1 Tax=Halorubellus sp. PRR65 TaxID=3098148 RepID=UPI002B262BEA|nr:3,4-dihydroxy-2-butanone-4-phosphate synthase [Halorubellus sp. PRR65]
MTHTDHATPSAEDAGDDAAAGDADATATDDASGAVDAAVAAFARGDPVCIHDAADREGETDIVYPASGVDSDAVRRMRNDAGGLVCVALADDVAAAYDLPFAQDVIDHDLAADHDLAYDERSSFSLTVNHVDTFTGITDDDRALTISRLGDAAASARAGDATAFDFAGEFRAPGHVHLLRAAPDLTVQREGHTELALELADAADVAPAAVVCEMLDDATGGATSPTDARAYADREGIPYVEGSDLVARFR